MFRIFAAVLLGLISITFPPSLVITIPVAIIWACGSHEARAERRRPLPDLPEQHLQAKAQRKALSSW